MGAVKGKRVTPAFFMPVGERAQACIYNRYACACMNGLFFFQLKFSIEKKCPSLEGDSSLTVVRQVL